MRILFLLLLILTSCSEKNKNCELKGTWKSVALNSDKAIDGNNDGVYNKDLLKEDDCLEIIFQFKNNGIAERFYKNKRTNCEFKKSTLNYIVEGDEIIFTVSGMKQKHKYDITECKLNIYGVSDSGMTESGKQYILINSILEKE